AVHWTARRRDCAGRNAGDLSDQRRGRWTGGHWHPRSRLYTGGNFRGSITEAEARRRAVFGRTGDARGHYGARLLQRRATQRDEEGGRTRGPGRRAHRERTDGGGAGLRIGQA